jgi:23S rRNA (uracil1939-C5)-methyltransferase
VSDRGSRGRGAGPARAGARLAELDEIEVTVEKLVAGGDGLARFEGIPLFVPRCAPGDRLRVRITDRRPDYGRAEIVELLEAGPGRREPPCPFFADCGGCDLQHLDDDLQPRLKAEAVLETLVRLGRLEIPEDFAVITGEPWGYRLRTRLRVGRTALGEPGAKPKESHEEGPKYGLAVGYHRRGSRELVPVDRCPILVPELEELLPRLPRVLGETGGRTPSRLDLAAGEAGSGRVTVAPVVEGLPHGEVTLEADGITYAYDARAFFQAHRGLVERLVEAVVGDGNDQEPDRDSTVLDLYAGVGLFALPLARRYGRVVAVEGDRVAARFCRNNARRNRLGNVEVVTRALETWIPELPEGAARAVVDPPRAGLHRKVRQALFRHGPRRLTYVSCHPATLARDLRQLGNRYRLESLTLIDLFPQTGHMETVAQLRRVEPGAS